ncbi:unnamed protein product [Sphagnum balticum]
MSSLDTDENGQQQQVSSFNYHFILVDYRFCCKEEFAPAWTLGSASEIVIRLEAAAAAAAVNWSLRYIGGSRIFSTWAPAAGGLRRAFAISETVANGIWVGAASHTTAY